MNILQHSDLLEGHLYQCISVCGLQWLHTPRKTARRMLVVQAVIAALPAAILSDAVVDDEAKPKKKRKKAAAAEAGEVAPVSVPDPEGVAAAGVPNIAHTVEWCQAGSTI